MVQRRVNPQEHKLHGHSIIDIAFTAGAFLCAVLVGTLVGIPLNVMAATYLW